MADIRNFNLPGIWADDAYTTIPQPPVPGLAYRNTGLDEATTKNGQKYASLGDSATWNQLLWSLTKIVKQVESQGILSWSNLTNYAAGAFVIGTNNNLYVAKKASGPASTVVNPVNDTTGATWNMLNFREPIQAFAAGTTMLFVQAAAPTGWTKQTTVNDAAIRVVSGNTGGTKSGTINFSTLFSSSYQLALSGTVGSTTLTVAQLATHSHQVPTGLATTGYTYIDGYSSAIRDYPSTNDAGTSASHTHALSQSNVTVNLNVVKIDTILCAKD